MPAMNGVPQSLQLERKYIELLEKRIKTLEALIESGDKISGKELPATSVGGDGSTVKETKEATVKDEAVKHGKEKHSSSASRVRSLVRRWDAEKFRWIDTTDVKAPDAEADTMHAFTIRKFLDPKTNEFSRSEVDVEARGLRGLLKEKLKHYPGHLWDSDPVNIQGNFAPIVHNWNMLQEEACKTDDKSSDEEQARRDLKELLATISTSSGNAKLDQYFKTRESHINNKTITYDTLWTIFPPGRLVYATPFLKQPQVFIVASGLLGFPLAQGKHGIPWSLVCWSYDWDGSKFGRKAYKFEFEAFAGSKAINTLPCYPLDYYTGEGGEGDLEALKARLIDRGQKFRNFCTAGKGKQMFTYEGIALSHGAGINTIGQVTNATAGGFADERSVFSSYSGSGKATKTSTVKPTSHTVKGTVMVDFGSWFQYATTVAPLGAMQPYSGDQECGCQICKSNSKLNALLKYDYDAWTAKKGGFEDDQYMICPPRVLGYVMAHKMWAQLQVDKVDLGNTAGDKDAFENKVELDRRIKDLLKGLVGSHEGGKGKDESGKKQGIEDVVEGKGKGLVILLHGPPGVGKTLTAETVAMWAGKPLFAVGVSDVGVEAQKVESNLERMFNLASQWEAVLLIDEADVFLDSRENGDSPLDKSALVSVLLRVLEYYEGILILTTNRIRTFDVAVQSRIHLAIKYEDLDKQKTQKIYKNFLKQLDDEGLIKDWEDVNEWVEDESADYKFNGRQIRNVVSSAMSIARSKRELLNRKFLNEIARKTKDFMDDTKEQMIAYKTTLKT